MALFFTGRVLDWNRLWAKVNITSTADAGSTKNLFISSLRISSNPNGTGEVYFNISTHRQGPLNPNDFMAIEERIQQLIAKCLHLKLKTGYCDNGNITLNFVVNTNEPPDIDPFYTTAIEIATAIWVVLDLEPYLLKTFSLSARELVMKDGGDTIELIEWLKRTHPLLNS